MQIHNGFIQLTAAQFKCVWPEIYDISILERELNELFFDNAASQTRYEDELCSFGHGDWIIDYYGGIPLFPAYALSKGASVLSIDPNRDLCIGLCHSFHEQIVKGNATVLHGCLGAAPITDAPPESFIARSNSGLPLIHGSPDVRLYSIDDLLSQSILPSVNFLRCNSIALLESILPGALATLKKWKPCISIREEANQSEEQLDALLHTHGLKAKVSRKQYEGFSVCLLRLE